MSCIRILPEAVANKIAAGEVVAFPKTTKAQNLMAESPGEVDQDQLEQLGIAIKKP
jgi:aspartyl-tRNA synthetase